MGCSLTYRAAIAAEFIVNQFFAGTGIRQLHHLLRRR
jgi:hypothetical protein